VNCIYDGNYLEQFPDIDTPFICQHGCEVRANLVRCQCTQAAIHPSSNSPKWQFTKAVIH
jgi:hypothetical protein